MPKRTEPRIYEAAFHGKFLLSAEYLVLKGATALALPLRFGQAIEVSALAGNTLEWESFDTSGTCWFRATFDLPSLVVVSTNAKPIADKLQKILLEARKLQPAFLHSTQGIHVCIKADYPLHWGLGSSSTLTAAIASWAGISPLKLHFCSSGGSGYDVACATAQGPLLYRLSDGVPWTGPVSFHPPFADHLFFAYLGNKQDTESSLLQVRIRLQHVQADAIGQADQLSHRMLQARTLEEFESVLREHESLISKIIGLPTLAETRFADLPGAVKSLGSWGGDFCLITWRASQNQLQRYLAQKNIDCFFSFNDIVLL